MKIFLVQSFQTFWSNTPGHTLSLDEISKKKKKGKKINIGVWMKYQKKIWKGAISLGPIKKKHQTQIIKKKNKYHPCWCFFRLEIVHNGLIFLVTFWRLRFIWLFFCNRQWSQGKFLFHYFSAPRTLHVGHFSIVFFLFC